MKERIISEAQRFMLNDLPLHKLRLSYQQMFKDLKKESIEAKIVKAADSFLDYESIGYPRKFFKELWQSVEENINSLRIDFFLLLLNELKKVRGIKHK